MSKKKTITFINIFLSIIAIIMIALGVKNDMFLPPILTGLGFLLIAWALHMLK